MKKCSVCKEDVPLGDYVELKGKIYCMIDLPEPLIKKVIPGKKKEIISCHWCDARFSVGKRRCPSCNAYNPLFDFHFAEYFFNILAATIVLSIVGFIIYAGVHPETFPFLVLLFPALAVAVLLLSILLAAIFYLGRWIRDNLPERNRKSYPRKPAKRSRKSTKKPVRKKSTSKKKTPRK